MRIKFSLPKIVYDIDILKCVALYMEITTWKLAVLTVGNENILLQ